MESKRACSDSVLCIESLIQFIDKCIKGNDFINVNEYCNILLKKINTLINYLNLKQNAQTNKQYLIDKRIIFRNYKKIGDMKISMPYYYDLCKYAIDISWSKALKYIPEKCENYYELIIYALTKSNGGGILLNLAPNNSINYELQILDLIFSKGSTIQFINNNDNNYYYLCCLALILDKNNINYVNPHNKNFLSLYEIYEKYYNTNTFATEKNIVE